MPNPNDLVVELRGKLDQFERDMKSAGETGANAVKHIEDRFGQMNRSISGDVAKGVFAGMFSKSMVDQFFNYAQKALREYADNLLRIRDLAKLSQEAPDTIGGLQKVGRKAGLDNKEAVKDLEDLSRLINDGVRDGNKLSELFEKNGLSLKNAKGEAIGLQEALTMVARLVESARTEWDKIKVLETAGLTRDWLKVLERGPDVLNKLAEAAGVGDSKLGDMIKKAEEFDKAWKDVSEKLKGYLSGAAEDFTRNVVKGALVVGQFFGSDEAKRLLAQLDQAGGKGEAAAGPSGPLAITVRPSSLPTGRATQFPTSGKGGKEEEDPEKFFENRARRVQEQTEAMEVETRTLGENVKVRTSAIASLQMEQALRRGGVKDIEEYRDRIKALSDAEGDAAKKLDDARRARAGFMEFQNAIGGQLLNTITELTRGAGTLEERLARAGERFLDFMLQAALQAALMGTGPFGFTMGSGQATGTSAGGLMGALGSMFGGARASGGPMDEGKWYIVGENGPERMRVGKGGGFVVPDLGSKGGGNGINVQVINNNGSKVSTARSGSGGLSISIDDIEQHFSRPGGAVDRMIRGRYGANPMTGA